jgi:hypothetical protein
MNRIVRRGFLFTFCLAALALLIAAGPSRAGDGTSFGEAEIFFELNDTDGDLGIHARIDGDPWRTLEITDPFGRVMLHVRAINPRLRRQGLTELFFESAEPPFDELPPEQFFARFPEGEYEIEAQTVAGGGLEGVAEVSHVLAAPPEDVEISGVAAAEDCDVVPLPAVAEPIVLSWSPVTESHPEIGTPGVAVEVDLYQVVIEGESRELTVDLPADQTEFELPAGLVEPGEEVKFEILVREANGNQTAVESCFTVL